MMKVILLLMVSANLGILIVIALIVWINIGITFTTETAKILAKVIFDIRRHLLKENELKKGNK